MGSIALYIRANVNKGSLLRLGHKKYMKHPMLVSIEFDDIQWFNHVQKPLTTRLVMTGKVIDKGDIF